VTFNLKLRRSFVFRLVDLTDKISSLAIDIHASQWC